MIKYVLVFLSFMLMSWQLMAQQTISGTVTDATDGSLLPGVNVVQKGTANGTTTDINGSYQLQLLDEGQDALVFSFVGMSSETVQIGDQTVINVSLLPDIQSLQEIVVVGYGVEKKSLVTGSISKIKSEALENTSALRVEQAIQGRVAGVSVLPTSGAPGAGMKVRIRGTGSNQGAEPLYIIDGMRAGGIEYLDPNDIESIEILKDAASAAIYGAEGANGVVLITTKSGEPGQSQFSYGFQYGIQSMGNLMEMMTAEEYAIYLEEAGVSGNVPDPAAYEGVEGTNWLEAITETAPMQRHTLSFSGGNENSTYLVSGSYFNQQGVIGGDKADFSRYTARLNSDHKINDWLEVGNRFQYSHFERSSIAENSEFGGVVGNAIMIDPTTPVIYTGSLPAHVQNALDDNKPLVRDDNGNIYGLSQYIFGEVGNPLAQMQIDKGGIVQDKFVGNAFAHVTPFEGLKITSRIGIDLAYQINHGWNPTYYFSSESLNNSPTVFDANDKWFSWQWENFATYNKSFGAHAFTILGGVSAQKFDHTWLGGNSGPMQKEQGNWAYQDFVPTNDNDRIYGSFSESTLASYFGRLTYNFDERYLFNATLRVDGSSKFGPANRWGYFPSFAAGWVITNESFWNVSEVNYLKLRASWGQNGSLSNLSNFQYADLITSGFRYPTGTGLYYIGAEPAVLPNPELRWETSEQIDIGIDAGFFEDRLSFEVDYFNKITRDLLTPSTPPAFVGNYAPYVNAGDVTNEGVDISLGYRNFEGAFTYDVSVNTTFIRNEVTYLNPLLTRVGGAGVGVGYTATYFEEGYPVWYFRGYETEGIFQNQAQIDQYVEENGLVNDNGDPTYTPEPGDPIVINTNEDNLITNDDMTYIGDPHPDVIFGTSINLAYQGFDLSVFAQGNLGNDVLMGFNRTDRSSSNKPKFFYEDRWTGEGSTNSWFKADATNPQIYRSDLMVFDGSYLRIRRLQLGYTLPANVSDNLGIGNARFYVSFDDYFTFTSYPGMDPEAGNGDNNSLGIDRGLYPVPRKIMTGLSINF